MVNRSLISPTDYGEETVVVTFGNVASDKYPLPLIRVKNDDEEYCVEAAILQDLADEVLLGRDIPQHKHMVKCLPKGEHMALLQQLAGDNKVQLNEKPKDVAGSRRTFQLCMVETRLRARDQEKRSRWIKIAPWESSFHLTRSCLVNQENRGLT